MGDRRDADAGAGPAGAVAAMLGARSIAVVGASARPGSFGQRMMIEALRSATSTSGDHARSGHQRGVAGVHLVNPRYTELEGRVCLPSLTALPEPVDLVLLGVSDQALAGQLRDAAQLGARSAVVFGSAHAPGLRDQVRAIALDAGMALCGAGCMGFVNVRTGLRALGYLERDPIPAGPVALVTHSGSVFSTLLRTRRAIGYRLAVSSGQELVTTTAGYLEYVLDQDELDDAVIALVLETIRQPEKLRKLLKRAATMDVPVVLLPVGASAAGSRLVSAHSGAIAGGHGAWEALMDDTGALGVRDLAELTDTLELLTQGRRRRPARIEPPAGRRGLAAVHDSGAERALTADLAQELGVPFANIAPETQQRLAAVLDDGLIAENPLDVWGTGADTHGLFRTCLSAMAADPRVGVTVLAVDLVPEYDGDTAYPDAIAEAARIAAAAGHGPIAVLAGVASAIDDGTAARLRDAGVAVLEGTRSGLVAVRNLLAWSMAAAEPGDVHEPVDVKRQVRWRARLGRREPLSGVESFALLADYGVTAAAAIGAADAEAAVRAAARIGYPVVLKTDVAGITHKSDVGGVLTGLAGEAAVRAGYADLSARLGPEVLVAAMSPAGTELSIGIVRDPMLGPLVVVAAGGALIEILNDRVVTLPPITPRRGERLVQRLRIAHLLNGFRGAAPGDVAGLALVIAGIAQLAAELGDHLAALDVNPVIVSAGGAVAVDVLVEPAGQKAGVDPGRDARLD